MSSKEERIRSRPRVQVANVSFLRSAGGGGFRPARLAPSASSLLLGIALLAAAAGLYFLARGTSAFAVRRVAVVGAPQRVGLQVQEALASARGESLLVVDLAGLEAAVEAVPTVAAVSFDRDFPHTLTAAIVPERPVAVLRRGPESWLVAASGRVMATIDRGTRPRLPRIWVPRGADVRLGDPVAGDARRSVRAVSPLARRPLPSRVTAVRASEGELTLILRAGFELRLGDDSDRALKLELARRILPTLLSVGGYLDVSVPERPVAASTLNSQVEVEGVTSTSP